jgi:NAD kinase
MPTPRVVVVHRRTEYDELIVRHGTRGQAQFFLSARQQDLAAVERRHDLIEAALRTVSAGFPSEWARATVERADLSRFVFRPEDIVVVVGQDGLVANLAKYVARQPVIGIDPLPGTNAGVLVPHRAQATQRLLAAVAGGSAPLLERTMVQASTDDGQSLVALNEIYLGASTHQSARYTVRVANHVERQSSSGLIVGTGTGSTGWCRSLQQIQGRDLILPGPADRALAWFVREPWPSPSTGATMTHGLVADEAVRVHVESDTLVAFGDGVEDDRLILSWGQHVTVAVAERCLVTVV